MFKKALIASAMLVSIIGANAAETATFGVTGGSMPSSCSVALGNGGFPIEEIREIYHGKIEMVEQSSSDPLAPGMLKKHYSPNKIVRNIIDFKSGEHAPEKVGFLKFSRKSGEISPENQFILSANEDLKEASQRLFEGLRYLDNLNIDIIFLENVPNNSLGLAINDRLKRAAASD